MYTMNGLSHLKTHIYLICWLAIQSHVYGFIGDNSTLNSTWFAYLEHSLEGMVSSERHCVASHLKELNIGLGKMADWCFPNSHRYTNTTELPFLIINRIVSNLPCGYFHIHNTSIWRQSKALALIQVNKLFYVQLLFLVFNMEDSGASCEHSVCEILQPTDNKTMPPWELTSSLCGQRKPWNQTVQSNEILIYLHQRHVQKVFDITFTYFTLDIDLANRYILYSHTIHRKTAISHLDEATHQIFHEKILEVQQWVISVRIGSQIRFELVEIDYESCSLKLFDGPHENKQLHQEEREFKLRTTYFQSLMILICDITFDSIFVSPMFVQYRDINIKPKRIQIGTKVRIKSDDRIIHDVYSVEPNKGMYPNVSIDVHKFHGWNEGGCNFGGYAIKQYVPNTPTLGPFCSKDSSRYVNPHGLEYFVLGNYVSHFIVFSYGFMYSVHFDLIISSSKCEGALEPILSLLPNNNLPQQGRVLGYYKLDNAVLYLVKESSSSLIFKKYRLIVVGLSKCITIQSVSVINKVTVTYQIIHTVEMFLKFMPTKKYLDIQNNRNQNSYFRLQLVGIDQSSMHHIIEDSGFEVLQSSSVYASIEIYQTVSINYQYKSFTLNVTPVQRYPLVCSESSTKKQLRRNNEYYISLVGRCGLIVSNDAGVHNYNVLAAGPNSNREQTFMYVMISTENCSDTVSENGRDVLTLFTDTYSVSHSVDFLVRKWFLQSRDGHLVVQFIKRNSCAKLLFHYRIEQAIRMTRVGKFEQGEEFIKVLCFIYKRKYSY